MSWPSSLALRSKGAGSWVVRLRETVRVLPLAPIWPGFAFNTLFYAALLWLLFAPFTARRLIRRNLMRKHERDLEPIYFR